MSSWRRALEHIAATERLLVALDFDGVLAPLVDNALDSRMLPKSRAAITELSSLPSTAVAFVSGRTLADLTRVSEYADDSAVWLAGSHGAEFQPPRGVIVADDERIGADEPEAANVVAAAEAAIAELEGAKIERKAFGFALHTRLADDEATTKAQERIADVAQRLAPQWRARTGHDVREYAWRHEGKDTAVARLRDMTGATAVLFAGDDVTDEDALRSLLPGDLGVRVGPGETAATVRVADPAEFAELLTSLAQLRAS